MYKHLEILHHAQIGQNVYTEYARTNMYSEFRLRSKIPCCVRNPEGLRTQPGKLRTCGRVHECAIARVLA